MSTVTKFFIICFSIVIVGGLALYLMPDPADDSSELYGELIKYKVPLKSVTVFSTAEKANHIKMNEEFVGFKIELQEPLDGEKFLYRESHNHPGIGQLFALCDKPEEYVSKYALTLFRREKQKFNNGEIELFILYGWITLEDI